jgi:hypothetical protein
MKKLFILLGVLVLFSFVSAWGSQFENNCWGGDGEYNTYVLNQPGEYSVSDDSVLKDGQAWRVLNSGDSSSNHVCFVVDGTNVSFSGSARKIYFNVVNNGKLTLESGSNSLSLSSFNINSVERYIDEDAKITLKFSTGEISIYRFHPLGAVSLILNDKNASVPVGGDRVDVKMTGFSFSDKNLVSIDANAESYVVNSVSPLNFTLNNFLSGDIKVGVCGDGVTGSREVCDCGNKNYFPNVVGCGDGSIFNGMENPWVDPKEICSENCNKNIICQEGADLVDGVCYCTTGVSDWYYDYEYGINRQICREECDVNEWWNGMECECIDGYIEDKEGNCVPIPGPVMRVYLDQQYKEDTLKYRKFRPDKITPFDDIIVEFETAPLGVAEIPVKMFSGYINFELALEGVLKKSYSKNGRDFYQLKINGWDYDNSNGGMGKPAGWADKEQVDRITEFGKVTFVAYLPSGEEIRIDNLQKGKDKWVQGYSNCLHVYGRNDARNKIGFHYGESTGHLSLDVAGRSIFLLNNLYKYSPFREYSEQFSSYSDLRLISKDSGIGTSLNKERGSIYFINEEVEKKILAESDCVKEYGNVFYHNFEHDVKAVWPGYATGGGGWQFVMYQKRDPWFFWVTPTDGLIFVHEFGHSFGGLDDEYYNKGREYTPRISRNCNNDLNYWGNYGDDVKVCFYGENYFRPSEESMMNSNNEPFNVVSCGFVLLNMKLCNIRENCWAMCMNSKWNTLKPEKEKPRNLCNGQVFYPENGEKCCNNKGNQAVAKECCGSEGEELPYDPAQKKCCMYSNSGSSVVADECCGDEGMQVAWNKETEACCVNSLGAGFVGGKKGDSCCGTVGDVAPWNPQDNICCLDGKNEQGDVGPIGNECCVKVVDGFEIIQSGKKCCGSAGAFNPGYACCDNSVNPPVINFQKKSELPSGGCS